MRKNTLEKEFIEKIMGAQGIVHKVCSMYCTDEEEKKSGMTMSEDYKIEQPVIPAKAGIL